MSIRKAVPRALVTGGSSGIGRELVKALCMRGWEVEFCGRNEQALEDTRSQAKASWAHTCDVMDPQQVLKMIQAVAGRGQISLLVNNAGIFQPAPLLETTCERMDDSLRTNLMAPIHILQEVVSQGLLEDGGTVISILSVAAETAFPGSALYGASKAGLAQAMRVARAELRPRGIRICNIHPGATRTPAWGDQVDVLANRLMPAESVANCILTACLDNPGVVVEEMTLRPPAGDL